MFLARDEEDAEINQLRISKAWQLADEGDVCNVQCGSRDSGCPVE